MWLCFSQSQGERERMVTLEEVVYNSVRIKSELLTENEQGALVVDKIYFKARLFWYKLVLYTCPLFFFPLTLSLCQYKYCIFRFLTRISSVHNTANDKASKSCLTCSPLYLRKKACIFKISFLPLVSDIGEHCDFLTEPLWRQRHRAT